MQHHWVVPLVAAVANAIICLLVLRGGVRNRALRVFVWLIFNTVLWNLDIFSLGYFSDGLSAEWWSQLFRIGVCFAPVAFFHAALLQAESRGRLWTGLLVAAYAVAGLLVALNFHGDLVHGVSRHEWGWYIEPTRLYSLVTVYIATCMALALERTWHAYRRPTSPRQRVQAKFWFLATVVQTPFVLTNLLPVYGVGIYPLGSLGNVFTMGIMAYAIARHRLMDVDYVVRKGVSFTLAATLVLVPGGVGIWVLSQSLATQEPGIMVCAALALALIAVILIPASQAALDTPDAALFRARAWEVAIRLRLTDRPTGLIALGRNRDFRIFSAEDLQLLAAVAAGASVALENASLSRQLRRSEVVLERANRLSSLGMLAAGIAHEIRNPLVAVKTFLEDRKSTRLNS